MRPECSEKKLEPANQPTYSRQQTSAAMGYQPAKERLRNRNSPRTAADMSVTVGKIKELARHFHGEAGASFPPPSAIYLPGQEPPFQGLIRSSCGLSTASQQNERVDVRCVPKADMLTDVVSKLKACYPRKRTFGSRDWNVILKTRRKVVTIVLAWSVRPDASFHRPADIVTCPVLYRPIARAAAGDRSMSLPRTHGPRSLMRTVTHPLWQTRI